MAITKVFGPPGAGKTTYLLNIVESELEDEVPSHKIGYFAFTKRAAIEAKERGMRKFPHLNPDTDFPWFRTLHSLAFRCLAIGTKDMMAPENYHEFACEAGIQISVDAMAEEDFMVKTDHPILNEINIARTKGLDLREHYNRSKIEIEWHYFEYIERAYRHYKESRNLLDFTDLLERVVEDPERLPKLELVIVDEAQDLSRLQWRLVEALSKRCSRMYIAGDDDQCQPEGTRILTTEGEVPIEHLDPAIHRLISYDRNGSYVVGHRRGYSFEKAVRPYTGVLYSVKTHGTRSSYTGNHRCIVRWKPIEEVSDLRVVYLMQKGAHFRIGQCQLFRADGCVHAWVRAHLEQADRMWFIKTVRTPKEAFYWENHLSYKYGIPQTVFKNTAEGWQEAVDRLHLGLSTEAPASQLLRDFGLCESYPIYDRSIISQRRGGSQIFETRACNLMPEAMRLAHLEGSAITWNGFTLETSRHQGPVYSLQIEKHHNYFADGILTHNCIYAWAGADVNTFLSFPGNVTVLDKSYRIPSSVHRLANQVVRRIKKRQPKVWRAREEAGSVQYYNDWQQVDITRGDWLVLAAANYMLTDMHDWLKSQGLLFERHGQRSIPESVLTAVVGWERLRKGAEVDYPTLKTIYKYLSTHGVKHGYKGLKTASVEGMYTMDRLKAEQGLLTDAIWHEALTRIAEDRRNYIIALLRRGSKITGRASIKLSTIHGAKGGEADNVLLIGDLTTKFAKDYERNSDDINRLLYVGITRAKQSLHIVLPRNEQKGFRL